MKIAVIGTGAVGGTLGQRWAELGHSVRFGVRDLADAAANTFVKQIKGEARLASVRDAVTDADVVVLATPYAANAAAIAAAGDLTGKIVIDVTNPVGADFALAVGFTTSGAEEVAKLARGARVYKAMNQVGFEVMADPAFAAGKPVMFVAGDEAQGKEAVLGLVAALGFEAIDAGDLKVARLLEPYAMLWIHLMARRKMGRRFAFGLLRR
ncbi:MAG TPA: NAD(P)-binding domain-containing protein [Stellaceae bacterium]|nr:NAD(P)-binding domain-containing protein [Stellaceae bacterium]